MSQSFGEILKKLRESKKNPSVTQVGLGKYLDVTSKQIQRYEDNFIPPLDKLIKLCDYFEYDLLSPATGGRCTILDYFDNKSSENKGKTYQIDKGIPLPSLKLVSENNEAQQKNTQQEPGIVELVKVLESQNKILMAGFSLNDELKRILEVQPSQPGSTQGEQESSSGPGIQMSVPPKKVDENDKNH